jgi:phosphate/phosphite/phosphonate ABC transporter binding protein
MKKIICSLVVFFIFSMAVCHAQPDKQTLVIATYQYADNPRIKNIEPFAAHLSKLTGYKTEVKSYPNVQAMLAGMNAGEADIVFMNTFGYLLLKEQSDQYEISAALHIPDAVTSTYTTVFVTTHESGITSLKEGVQNAADNFLILVSEGSTSGNLVPRLKLASMMEDAPEKFFLEVRYAGTHQKAMQQMMEEKYAMAAFGSDEYYKLGADTSRVKLLWESPPIQLGPVVCKKSLPTDLKLKLQQSLLQLHNINADALEAIKTGWTEAKPADKYMIIDDAYYHNLINLAGDKAKAYSIIKRFAR